MNDCRILLVTEANQKVASGHLYECIVCLQELKKISNVFFMINSDMPVQFKNNIPDNYLEYKSNIQEEVDTLIEAILKYQIDLILFNLREIKNEFVKQIREKVNVCIICIDEFGHRELDADVIINPMIDKEYWVYDTNAQMYCGAKYLVLPPEIVKYHEMDRIINNDIHKVTVSMGGVDAYGTTLKIARWLPEIWKGVHLNLVIGGGFPYKEELNDIVKENEYIKVYQNINFLYNLFFESDLAICAGGNTLHELAVMGVPAIVIPSMPHELRNGQAFQKEGFSICCDLTSEIKQEDFVNSLEKIEDIELRKSMELCGKKITDGRGFERVCSIVKKNL